MKKDMAEHDHHVKQPKMTTKFELNIGIHISCANYCGTAAGSVKCLRRSSSCRHGVEEGTSGSAQGRAACTDLSEGAASATAARGAAQANGPGRSTWRRFPSTHADPVRREET